VGHVLTEEIRKPVTDTGAVLANVQGEYMDLNSNLSTEAARVAYAKAINKALAEGKTATDLALGDIKPGMTQEEVATASVAIAKALKGDE
jgi:hypothetical protein